jgi:hypothetical protein
MSEPAPPPAQQTAESLLELLYAFVLPLYAAFLGPEEANRAARGAMRFYQPRTHHEAMLAARTIAFSLAAQDNLRLSMAADLAVAVKVRLRANANALDRSAERNHAALEKSQANPAAVPDEAELADRLWETREMIAQTSAQIAAAKAVVSPNPRPAIAPAPVAAPAATAPAKRAAAPAPQPSVQPPRMASPRDRLAWADAMTVVANEMTAGLSAVPPAHRKQERLRAKLLRSAAMDVAALARGSAAQRQTVAAAPAN